MKDCWVSRGEYRIRYCVLFTMFRAVQVVKHGGPEVMKIITNAELPRITSSQVFLFLLHQSSRSLLRFTMRLSIRSILIYVKDGTHRLAHALTLRV